MHTLIVLLAAALLGIQLSGCTVIGFGIGTAVDHKLAIHRNFYWSEVRSIPVGRQMEVALTSGDTLRGTFSGLRALSSNNYRRIYDSLRVLLTGDSELPRIGETVEFTFREGKRAHGTFYGFEAEAIAIHREKKQITEYLQLSETTMIQYRDGYSFDVNNLRTLASSRVLPSMSKFVIQSGNRTQNISLERIQKIHIPPQPTHLWVLGLVGLALDAWLAAVVTDGFK